MHGVKLLIKTQAWITISTENVSQYGMSDAGVSYQQLIFCTRKISRSKPRRHKQTTICTLKNCSPIHLWFTKMQIMTKIVFPLLRTF